MVLFGDDRSQDDFHCPISAFINKRKKRRRWRPRNGSLSPIFLPKRCHLMSLFDLQADGHPKKKKEKKRKEK